MITDELVRLLWPEELNRNNIKNYLIEENPLDLRYIIRNQEKVLQKRIKVIIKYLEPVFKYGDWVLEDLDWVWIDVPIEEE